MQWLKLKMGCGGLLCLGGADRDGEPFMYMYALFCCTLFMC